MQRRVIPISLLLILIFPLQEFAQVDPGVRGGAAGAGGPLASVAANNPTNILNFFNTGKDDFEEVDSVSGTITGEDGSGLGPRFNSRSCAACHAQPAVGGTSPAVNPQIADATADGARNTIPSFITINGPVREARFPFFFTNGVPDQNRPNGGVEDLYTIAGRTDAPGCTTSVISQPSFATAVATNNVIFRIPTPTFGAGLIENIDDSTLLANAASNAFNAFGVGGTFNREGNTGTITRFGWKAQNKSLEIFAGEAYLVEQGVSNELFTQERPLPGEGMNQGLPAACRAFNPTPEDITHFDGVGSTGTTMADTVGFAMFMRLLAQPTPSTTTPGGATSINTGRVLFNVVGCNTCHTPTLRTVASHFTPSLSNANANLFSDMEIHHMGSGLADNVSQGGAGGDQFRTAPLWGLGQRIFFLHNGRTRNLLTAIREHNSPGSEANTSIFVFNALPAAQQQDVLNFLRSL
ncbi:MAG TPA: di-heme oxidoredictase family protein [Thermoanaerobaculia bacterium]|nr:di-heme oxidoredictase family protein [Thermoanaerobaculia bacterium]